MTELHKQCRKEHCEEEAMQYGRYNWDIVNGMDRWHQTTTDVTLCHTCNYWLQQSGKPGLIVQRNGELHHYNIGAGGEDAPQSMKGFDGARVRITVTDCERNLSIFGPKCVGVSRESTNLWSQGTVPERYTEVMVNAPNKIFVKIDWLHRG